MKTILMTDDNLDKTIERLKEETRRLGGLKEINKNPDEWELLGQGRSTEFCFQNNTAGKSRIYFPRYQLNDIVGIKENFQPRNWSPLHKTGLFIKYFFDDNIKLVELTPSEFFKIQYWKKFNHKKSKLFMFDSMIRRQIQITGIGCERLQNISIKNIIREGIEPIYYYGFEINEEMTRNEFQTLWDSINKKRGYGWEVNPWVFVYKYKYLEVK